MFSYILWHDYDTITTRRPYETPQRHNNGTLCPFLSFPHLRIGSSSIQRVTLILGANNQCHGVIDMTTRTLHVYPRILNTSWSLQLRSRLPPFTPGDHPFPFVAPALPFLPCLYHHLLPAHSFPSVLEVFLFVVTTCVFDSASFHSRFKLSLSLSFFLIFLSLRHRFTVSQSPSNDITNDCTNYSTQHHLPHISSPILRLLYHIPPSPSLFPSSFPL